MLFFPLCRVLSVHCAEPIFLWLLGKASHLLGIQLFICSAATTQNADLARGGAAATAAKVISR
uniref:Uncharacterized protein n=1 Tax=Arundo donax TaxID=35708 RepID=A0A0A9AIA5_ARUDO